VAVTHEAGPTGFGLARSLVAAGIICDVAMTVPSVEREAARDLVRA
jgi:hypothetical protein